MRLLEGVELWLGDPETLDVADCELVCVKLGVGLDVEV